MRIIKILLLFFISFQIIYAKEIKQNGTTFTIKDKIYKQLNKNHPDLIKLILVTDSMDNDEKQFWFNIIPSMTHKKIDRLYEILDTERKKLRELEVKYQKEIKNLNEKHLNEWNIFEVSQKIIDKNAINILNKDKTYVLFKAHKFSKVEIINIKLLTKDILKKNLIMKFKDFNICSNKYNLIDYITFDTYVKHIVKNINNYQNLYSVDQLISILDVYFSNLYKKANLVEYKKNLNILKNNNVKILDKKDSSKYKKKLERYQSDLDYIHVFFANYNGIINKIDKKMDKNKFLSITDISILITLNENSKIVKKYINYISNNPTKIINLKDKGYTYRILIKVFIDKYKKSFNNEKYISINNQLLSNLKKIEYRSIHYKNLTNDFFKKDTYEMYQNYLKLKKEFIKTKDENIEGKLLEYGTYLALKYLEERQFVRVYQILNYIKKLGLKNCSSIKNYTEYILFPYIEKRVISDSSREYYPKNNLSTSFFDQIQKSDTLRQDLSYENFIDKYIKQPKKWAIVIGVNNYNKNRTGYDSLPYAVNDSKKMYDTLINIFGFKKERIKYIVNEKATKRNILSALLKITKQAKKGDDILIFFSGHGDKDKKNAYLIPYDYDKNYAPYSSINIIDEIAEKIDNKFRHSLLIFDSCYSGFAKKVIVSKNSNNKNETPNYILKMILNNGFVNILTAGEDEEVYMSKYWHNHSVFTYYLIKGIKGEADYNQDTIISLNELSLYLENKVSNEANQTPQKFDYNHRYNDEKTLGQFIFIKKEGF